MVPTVASGCINLCNSHQLTFISDKQKGFIEALKHLWPNDDELPKHRHCDRHVQSNSTKIFKGQFLMLKMKQAAMSTTTAKFKGKIEEIKKTDVEGHRIGLRLFSEQTRSVISC